MHEIRNKAKELMKGACRVCPVCDGRACAGEVPGMGGIGSGASFKDNVRALADLGLNMRLIHEAAAPSTALSLLGMGLALPVLAAPIAGIFNFGQAVSEQEYAAAVVDGSRAAGSIGSTGDGVLPGILDAALDALARAQGHGLPFIKPWEGAELEEKMDRVLTSGCKAMGMDIDAAGLITLRKMGRPVGPKSVRELTRIVDNAHRAKVKFIIKGVMTVQDAHKAVETGADALVVSNHGGRVLASSPGTARVLPAIARAVGRDIAVLVDGGVRCGQDVLKMLALGARAVCVGRPVTIAATGGGSQGVAACFNGLREELEQAMILTGCPDLASISEEVLFRP